MGLSEFSNDIKAKTTAASQVSTSSSATNASATDQKKNDIIPVGKSSKPDEIINKLIESKEFQALSRQEKLEELKKQFPNILDENTLKEILNKIETTIATNNEAIDPSISEEKINNLSKNIDINGIMERIKNLAQQGEINIDKKTLNKLKKFLRGILQGTLDTKRLKEGELKELTAPFAKILDSLAPDEIKSNPEAWNEKKPLEKLYSRLDKFIDTIIMPGFDSFPEENKTQIRNGFIDNIGKLANPNWTEYEPDIKGLGVSMIALMVENMEKQDINFEKLLTGSPEDTKKAFKENLGNILDTYFISSDLNTDLEGKTPKEQLIEIITAGAEKAGIKISKNSSESMDQIIDMLGSAVYKNEWAEVSKKVKERNNPEELNRLIDSLSLHLCALKEFIAANPDKKYTAKDFLEKINVKYEVLSEYEKKHNIPLTPSQAIQRNVILALGHEPISNQNILTYLEKKIQTVGLENLSTDEKAEYDRVKQFQQDLKNAGLNEEDQKRLMKAQLKEASKTLAYEIQARYKGDFNKYLIEKFGLPENSTPEEIQKILTQKYNNGEIKDEELKTLFSQIGDYDMLLKISSQFGINKEQIYNVMGFEEGALAVYGITNIWERTEASAHLANAEDKRSQDVGSSGMTTGMSRMKPKDASRIAEIGLSGPHGSNIAQKLPEKLWAKGYGEKNITELGILIGNNENISTENRGTWLDSTIQYAPTDDIRVNLSNNFTNDIKNPDMLEYIGAASKYVEEPGKRSQYTSYVTEAAKSYPPATQARIQQAIETGKTSFASSTSSSTAQTTRTPSTNTASAPVVESKTTPKSNVPTQPQVVPDTRSSDTRSSDTRSSDTRSSDTKTTVTNPASSSISTEAKTSTTSNPKTLDINTANQRTTEALQAKKETALNHIEEVQDKITVEQAEKEITDKALKDFVDTLEELEATEDPSKVNADKIKKFINSNSISVIYAKLVDKFGTSILHSLISAVASFGNSSKIDALASIIKDGNLLEELFAKCQNKRLLDKLQPTTVKKFIPLMSDLSVVRSDIMYEFIMELISSNASPDEIKKYLYYLPFGMQANICEAYNNLKGVALDSNFALKPSNNKPQENQQEKVNKVLADKPQEKENDKKAKAEEPKTQPAIKSNELTAVRNDGVKIKHKESFAGISDQYDEDAYDIVEEETGKTASQRESLLTPGSYEWNLKYNKQAPATAFTMAALEENEEDGVGTFGSNKVGMGQKIKKKYQPFKFNA